MDIRLLEPIDSERAVALLAQAFYSDPAWIYIVPEADQRHGSLANLFRSLVTAYIRNQQVYGVGEPLQGLAIWSMPNQGRPPLLGFINSASFMVLGTPGLIGIMKRSLKIALVAKAIRKYALHEPHYYLEFLAVAPDAQGQGWASKLLRPLLAQADAQACTVFVDTFKPANVLLYEHFGFVNHKQQTLGALGLQIFLLRRPAFFSAG